VVDEQSLIGKETGRRGGGGIEAEKALKQILGNRGILLFLKTLAGSWGEMEKKALMGEGEKRTATKKDGSERTSYETPF